MISYLTEKSGPGTVWLYQTKSHAIAEGRTRSCTSTKAGTTDAVDTEAAARAVIAGRSLSTPKDSSGQGPRLSKIRRIE